MNKSQKPRTTAQPRPLTQEERMAAISRGFTQQYNSIAQGVLYNLAHNPAIAQDLDAEELAESAIQITNAFMEKVGPACDACFEAVMSRQGKEEEETEKEGE